MVISMLPAVRPRGNSITATSLEIAYLRWLHMVFWGLLALTMIASQSVHAAEEANILRAIKYTSMAGDRVDVALEFAGNAPTPNSFVIENPARIALDLPDTSNQASGRAQQVGVGAVQSISAAEANHHTRIVISLSNLVPYTIRVENNRLIVSLNAASTATTSPAKTNSKTNLVEAINFRRGEHGEGQVLLTLSDKGAMTDVSQRGKDTIVTLRNTQLPEKLRQRYDVLDFATPVQAIIAQQAGSNTELTITSTGPAEHVSYQTDRQLTIELRTPVQNLKRGEQPVYTGKPITLNFQNVETRTALQILADVSGKNMVVSDSVNGSMALRLQNVPWDQALDIIVKSRGLATRETGNVIFIAPAEEIAAHEKLELEARKQVQQLAPLRSEFIQVNYAKAADVAAMLKGENSLLSERGKVSVDTRTNLLLVQDTAERLADIRTLVSKLDIPVSQVLIESRIVLASDQFNRALGARFGVGGRHTYDNGDGSVTGGGSLESSTSTTFPPPLSNRLNWNGAASPPKGTAGALALSILGPDYLLDLELSALQAEGKGEVISNPHLITANQKKASIRQGVEIPYQEAASSGATSVSFKDAVLKLEVTPQITPDDRIIMDLTINRDDVGQTVPSGIAGGTIPSIDTRQIETQVLVDNGDTIVLGGIYEQTRNNSVNKIPLFGDIPVLGALFRQTNRQNDKSELLIFITPKILKQGMQIQG